ncbi:MAG: sulfatase [Planctomycetota bacterium]
MAFILWIFGVETGNAKEPNVLFILTEDQGAHLSLLETPGLKTPSIDVLASSSVYFENAFVSYPVCSPSKAAIYTGLHNHTNGILNNTHNFHMPASEVTDEQRSLKLARTNRIHSRYSTLTEILHRNGYYQGVTHKLHVLPNEKFPYDEFLHGTKREVERFIQNASDLDRPWFLMVNIPNSHRPFPNSDKESISVDPKQVELPPYLPDTPEVRKDWSEYLAAIEEADHLVGETLAILEDSGHSDNTIVIFMSDHGPTFPHGKMTLYDLGLRVPLIIRMPDVTPRRSEALVSELDLMPTILELCSIEDPLEYSLDGKSLAGLLTQPIDETTHNYQFAEISNRGPLPNDGIQERCIFDERWKLIYRNNVDKAWRQVNADSRQLKVWGNRSYGETLRWKDNFPEAFRVLAEMDPQNLEGEVPSLEVYDLQMDPHEMNNLAGEPAVSIHRNRLLQALAEWVRSTQDPAVSPDAIEALKTVTKSAQE